MHTFNENDIITYDNFFEPEDFKSISNYLNRPMWKWGHGSLPDGHPDKPEFATPFWKMDLSAEYFASLNWSGALLIKSDKTLSRNLMTSLIMSGSSFHSSYFSKFNEDKQHTAVLSLPSLSIPVGKVISLHKLEVLTVRFANL